MLITHLYYKGAKNLFLMPTFFPFSLSTMDMVYRGHKNELDKLVSDIADAKENIESCEKRAPGLESRFRFFQELRGYVRDLVECLNEKVCPFCFLILAHLSRIHFSISAFHTERDVLGQLSSPLVEYKAWLKSAINQVSKDTFF